VLFKARGHDVRVLAYHPFDFFREYLEEEGVPVEFIHHRGKLHRIFAVSRALRSGKSDAVIAFLQTPCIIAELSRLVGRRFTLVVSERNTEPPGPLTLTRRTALWLHRFADAVVTNSYAQESELRKIRPGLSSRITTIQNCVDLERFQPSDAGNRIVPEELNLLCVGRFQPQKNYSGLLKALEIVNQKYPEVILRIDAYGNDYFIDGKPGPQAGTFLEFSRLLEVSPSRANFRIYRPVKEVAPLYHKASALCLTSIYEGCSNVICEAMACGRPVLAGRVGDNTLLVEDGVNGILFDPRDPEDIANAIVRFSKLSSDQRTEMGREGRRRAEELLSPERFVSEYEDLLKIYVN
jgi:glycosyltransferase involved in cell wall biosynthesis